MTPYRNAKRENVLCPWTRSSVGSKHLVALREICSDGRGSPESHAALTKLTKWINRWRDAADEAETLGLDSDISYKYWHHNIELPEEVTEATRWFDTAEKLTTAVDTSRLVKFASEGERYIWALEACRSSWPRFRHWSIQRRFLKWNLLVAEWSELVKSTRPDHATMDLITQLLDRARDGLEDALVEQGKMRRLKSKADMLKKRTCSHCGTTGSLSQVSFAYCYGCRHPSVARADRPRYCSEACQHAHWHAGHKDKCPCAHEKKEIVDGNGWLEQLARERAKRRK